MKLHVILLLGFAYLTNAQLSSEYLGDGGSGAYNTDEDGTIVVDETGCPEGYTGKKCAYKTRDLVFDVPAGEWANSWPFDHPMCAVYGHSSIFTFEGRLYESTGVCQYTMMERINAYEPEFSVKVTRDPFCGYGDCVTEIAIQHDMCNIIIAPYSVVVYPAYGSPIYLTPEDYYEANHISIWYNNNRRFVSLMDGAMVIEYDDRSDVLIHNFNFHDEMSGMCADADIPTLARSDPSYMLRYANDYCAETYMMPKITWECILDLSVSQACMVLVQGPLAECNRVVNPTTFIRQCKREMCLCNYLENEHCLCDITAQYAKACAAAFGEVGEWRDEAPSCKRSCSYGMEWTECGRGAVPSCSSFDAFDLYFTPCIARCQCPDGYVMDEDLGRCVKYEHCSCTYMDQHYNTGEFRMEDCNRCECVGGRWLCTEDLCNATAWAFGHHHFKTFDGTQFTFGDSCQVLLAKDVDSKFEVYVKTLLGERYTYEKDIDVFVRHEDHVMHYRLGRDGLLYLHIHGKHATDGLALQQMPHYKEGVVEIERYGERGFSMLLTMTGVRVRFDGVGFVVVEIGPQFYERVLGIGGNFNGDRKDDLMLPSKEIADARSFVHAWRKDWNCENEFRYNPSTCYDDRTQEICGHIRAETHRQCGAHADLDWLFQMCYEDACNSNYEMAVEMTCKFVSSVMSVCANVGVPDPLVVTHLIEECPVVCPEHKEQQDCNTDCASTCQSVGQYCATLCYSGCFCPQGTYENDDGTCVSIEECSCFHDDGLWYESGSITTIYGQECTCQSGLMTCKPIDPIDECEGDMKYYDCDAVEAGFAFTNTRSCAAPFFIGMMVECISGCACPSGLYLEPTTKKCVTLEQCGCMGANDKYFTNGESYFDDCNECTCVGGLFTCTDNPCPMTCSSSGGSHYNTFDGLLYDFHGECEYILATDYCSNNQGGGLFSVTTRNVRCGTTGLTCSKSVTVTIKNKQIVLVQGEQPQVHSIESSRFRRAITGYTDHRTAEIFTVKQKGLFTEISTCIGITLLWDNGTRIYLRLTPEFRGKVCGLCGNYDGKDTNDLITRTGIIGDSVEFGNSWKHAGSSFGCKEATASGQINNTCQLRPERREYAEKQCGVIVDADLFGDCHAKVPPQKYYDACVLDTCGCDSGGDCECFCTAVAHYAHLCAQKGVVVEWRNMKRCPLMCEIYNKDEEECRWHYRACDTCITDTCCECQSPEDATWCVEGCFPKCPSGYILDEMTQKCVLEVERDTKCTRYSVENQCRICKPCDECKTTSGGVLRIGPGETKYFPLDTDKCEKEWCAATTDGDLCYNGTVNLYICEEEYKKIPTYDPYFYELHCVNSTTSVCKNCRDCHKECIIREDSCEGEKVIGDAWQKVFNFDPVPESGPMTYCKNYRCIAHPDATEPQCNKQVEEVQECLNTGEGKECEDWEELVPVSTGDQCCPLKYECVCVVCEHNDGRKDDSLSVGKSNDWCEDPAESNCCYTDTCYEKTDRYVCPKIERVQEPCTTGPTPTCATGYVWVNKTRENDCCPWGECECDSCVDYDLFNNKILRAVGATWNKKCINFKCVRGARSEDGCFESLNFENRTCDLPSKCPDLMHSVITGKDEFDCCDTYGCECNTQCFVEIDGKINAFPVDTEFTKDGCFHLCIDPRPGYNGSRTDQEDCPDHQKICHKPADCPDCHVIVGEEEDECGCPKHICKEIERCPVPKCSYPYIRTSIPADPCKAPCYNCTCDHNCWDEFDNRTYLPEETWRRIYRKDERKCEDCVCTNDIDEDGCLKEQCERVPCPAIAECPSPYDEAVTTIDECGCTVLIECKCMYCKLGEQVLEDKAAGSSWTVGDTELGCYDTYTCSNLKDIGQDKECYNVTKERNSCPEPIVCPPNYRRVKDEAKSCCYPDEECCDHYKCECIVCNFNGKSYNVSDTWQYDCMDYVCTDTVDEQDVNKCYIATKEDVPCTDPKPECEDCYVSYLKQDRVVPDFCCKIYDCKPENYCMRGEEKVANGTEWYAYEEDPNGCIKRMCYVSDDDWAQGICPTPIEVTPCVPDLRECEKCQNKTIVKDICDCDKVTCPPFNVPVQCEEPAQNQRIMSLATDDECYPSRNCCVCENYCLVKGIRRKLYETWVDEETCQRLRCVVPGAALEMMDKDADDWDGIVYDLDYKSMMMGTRKAAFLYTECQQDPSMCPSVLDVGCADPIPCGECQHTKVVKDKCQCDVNECIDYDCPPAPYNRTSCPPPKSKVVEVSLNGLHEYFPCCPVGNVCQCPDGCYDSNDVLRDVGEEWDEDGDYECGVKRSFRCRPATSSDEHECPHVEPIPCKILTPCDKCLVTIIEKDEYCCDTQTCIEMQCNVTSQADCEENYYPFTVMKTDAVKTKNECCPHYCECPEVCVDDFDQVEHDKNEKWTHPRSNCWDRFCLVDKTKVKNSGCPYIVNRTVCVEPDDCDTCYHEVDTVDSCGCTDRKCEKDPCPRPPCDNECKEIVDTGLVDSCSCPVLECRLKACPKSEAGCEDPEMDVYYWMDKKINKCCKQFGCRCNYTRCEEPQCPEGEFPVRNVTIQKCCCPEYDCIKETTKQDYCMLGNTKKTIGETWTNKDNVCELMQCTYENARSKKTKIDIFNKYQCNAKAVTCANYETPYWATTKEGCCRESVCPCTCQLYGDPHFTTFDGLSYDYQGKCTYTLMKEHKFNETEIIIDNELCRWWSARNKDLSCLKTMVVLHKGSNYTFTFGQKFLLNGIEQDVTDAWQPTGSDVRVEVYGYKTLQLKIISLGIEIIYKTKEWHQSLILKLPYESYEGKMAGLCGICNNDQTDDMTGRKLEKFAHTDAAHIDQFGISWMKEGKDLDHDACYPKEPECPEESTYPDCPTTQPTDECVNCENRCHMAHPKCNPCDEDPCQVLVEHEVFETCRPEVDADAYVPQCQYDVALLTNVTEVKCDACNSASIVQYAAMCETLGYCVKWRSSLGCPVTDCPANQEFRECDKNSLKYRSCDNLTVWDDQILVEGCFCPEGQVRKSANSQECIPAQCCFDCPAAPTCEGGSEPTTNGVDECDCPVYYCEECTDPPETSGECNEVGSCSPVATQLQGLTVNNDNVICTSQSVIDTQICSGSCSSGSEIGPDGELTYVCTSCKGISGSPIVVELSCMNGETTTTEVEYHTECVCEITPCE